MILFLLLLGLGGCVDRVSHTAVVLRQAMPADPSQVSQDVEAIRAGMDGAQSSPNDVNGTEGCRRGL